MFPKIEHINDILHHIQDKPEIKVIELSNGFKTLVSSNNRCVP